jgi:hypothetical protein
MTCTGFSIIAPEDNLIVLRWASIELGVRNQIYHAKYDIKFA